MSALVMGLVFERYPGAGGELLLALALADAASVDGTGIYLGVGTLAARTRQSVRTVQVQLRSMQASGWLLKVGAGHGGRGRHTVYRINPQWIKGAEAAPFSEGVEPDDGSAGGGDVGEQADEANARSEPVFGLAHGISQGSADCADQGSSNGLKGATAAAPFGPPPRTERVQIDAQKGAVAAAPANKPDEPYYSPIPPHEGDSATACAPKGSRAPAGAPPPPKAGKALKRSKSAIGLQAYLDACRQRSVLPVPEGCKVFEYADEVGISRDLLRLHWQEFRERHLENEKRQKDWLRTLLNSVKSNWYGLWALNADGSCVITTKGLQAQAWHDRERRAA